MNPAVTENTVAMHADLNVVEADTGSSKDAATKISMQLLSTRINSIQCCSTYIVHTSDLPVLAQHLTRQI